MSKFTFICEDEHIPFADDTITNKRTFEFSGVLLHEIVAEFEMFLKGCGFSFEGQLDFVNDTGDSKIDEDDDFDPFTTKINVLPERSCMIFPMTGILVLFSISSCVRILESKTFINAIITSGSPIPKISPINKIRL